MRDILELVGVGIGLIVAVALVSLLLISVEWLPIPEICMNMFTGVE